MIILSQINKNFPWNIQVKKYFPLDVCNWQV